MTILSLFMLSACLEVTGDTNNSVDESVTYGDGDVLECNAESCYLMPNDDTGSVVVGVYDADYTRIECESAGFFFCSIENMCLNQPLVSGTCN